MADIFEVLRMSDPRSFNLSWQNRTRQVSPNALSPDALQAAKHAGSTSAYADAFNGRLATNLGNLNEVAQDIKDLFVDREAYKDDHRDLANNWVGRMVAKSFPNQSVDNYLRAAAHLADRGLLVLDPDFKMPQNTWNDQYIAERFVEEIGARAVNHLKNSSFFGTHCFLADTLIDMWPLDADLKPNANGTYDENIVLAAVWQKPIEEVTPEDWVVSYDDNGRLKPGRVTRTFQNHSKHILDVHGLMMTPSHVTYCAKVDGENNRFAGTHAPIIDILRSDGALKKADGTLIRAATNCEVGSKDDEQFWAFLLYEDKDGSERIREKCQLRLGTRWMMPNGHHFSMREYMDNIGIELVEQGPQKGYVRFKDTGMVTVFAWTFSEILPKPEDYVLERSQVTLEEIYEADEWEAIRPQMPTPVYGEAGRSFTQEKTLFAGASSDHLPPNIPHSMRNSPNQPTMSRQQRRALDAKQRKNTSRTTTTVH